VFFFFFALSCIIILLLYYKITLFFCGSTEPQNDKLREF
jgi:hypothetical protein